jgi:membrane-associated phospholipid phosphatase
MTFLTDFADQAVVLPVVLVVALMLVAMGWRRGALVWLAVIGATFGAILVLKSVFLACPPVFDPWTLHSPSGHTAAAAVVAGGFATLLGGRGWIAFVVSILAAAAIGSSRVELGYHSLPEVLIGAAAGAAGAVALSRFAGRKPIARPVPLLTVAVVVAVLTHGIHLPAEAAISRFSHGMLDFVPACRGDVGGLGTAGQVRP